ncbi:MAG TPA: DUF4440 domain-containing protein [Longimicrobium sp.]|nr:DUF4440 domain-containing protein [Longimicrobium sp.]
MRPLTRRIAPLLLLPLAACAVHVQTPATQRAAASALVTQAQAFMASYADDLLAGRRDAIVARYDPRGAYRVGNGEKRLEPLDSIAAQYRGQWRPPASFAWRDLSYEVAGPDAVVVTGLFDWGLSAERKLQVSYTALLLRRDGRWVIRVEDESFAPPPRS